MPKEISLVKGDYLLREGEESTEMYYLQVGILGVWKRKSDKEVQIGTIYAGEIVGEMSFLDGSPRSASVKAVADCELQMIPASKFDDSIKKLPPWLKALINTLLERLRKANSRIKI